MSQKGSRFERWLCYHLSEWWTGDPESCVLWRSSQSGGRATVRSRKGRRTPGHHADLASTDPCSAPLTRLCVIEAKNGYNHVNIHCLLDRPKKSTQFELEQWIEKQEICREASGSFSWLLVHKRDGKQPYVIFPSSLMDLLTKQGCFRIPAVFFTARALIRRSDGSNMTMHLCATTLDKFLRRVSRSDVERIVRRLEHEQDRD